jgi:hypothetical protein
VLHSQLAEQFLRDEFAAIAPVVHNGVLEPLFGEISVVAHDDLELWRQFFRDIV